MSGDYIDVSSEPEFSGDPGPKSQRPESRPFLGIHFACCGVYRRVYLKPDQQTYVGHCPKCSRAVHFRVGPEGTDERFFTAY